MVIILITSYDDSYLIYLSKNEDKVIKLNLRNLRKDLIRSW